MRQHLNQRCGHTELVSGITGLPGERSLITVGKDRLNGLAVMLNIVAAVVVILGVVLVIVGVVVVKMGAVVLIVGVVVVMVELVLDLNSPYLLGMQDMVVNISRKWGSDFRDLLSSATSTMSCQHWVAAWGLIISGNGG